ncbi:MAG: 16S rRNA processing protein RimM [Deltaproteobacteria bacterium]|nr:16S rRNA processing protein RimM [Deltaproteobacteria bacterium]
MEQAFCPIGRVVKPHGVRGKIKVDYFGEDIDRFLLYQKIFIKDNLGKPESFEVLEVTPQPPRLILRLKGIERIEETEGLIGKEILVRREDLPEPEEGEYYWFEILGMVVETEKGRRIGTVKKIFPTGSHDVYVVEGKRGEIFLPATEGVIQNIDRQRRVMRVVRMEGLWEEEDEI